MNDDIFVTVDNSMNDLTSGSDSAVAMNVPSTTKKVALKYVDQEFVVAWLVFVLLANSGC